MLDKLNQEELNQVKNICREQGIVPVSNLPNEELRLTELKRLDIMDKDFKQDPRYTSLTELASYLTECPYSAINILGSKLQRCKIIFGLSKEEENDFETDEPRDLTICQFSLKTPHQPLIIENLLEDERTKQKYNHPEASSIRFYAGAPLISSRGFSLGVLCVVDNSPKSLKHNQIEGLRILADQIVSLIETDHNANHLSSNVEKKEVENTQSYGKYYSSATILFADFVGFTSKVESLEPGELLAKLNTFFIGFDKIVQKYRVRKVKTIGDAYMCVGGITENQTNHASEVCKVALDMLKFVDASNIQHEILGKENWQLRIGIHSGALIAGISGNSFDIWGDAVNIASRLESSSDPGKIHISEKTRDYLEGIGKLMPRGKISLKGKGNWSTFFLENLNQ